jgi:glycosyltransferase involved in cell wall biosynthesis
MIILSVNNSADIYGASRCLHRSLRLFVQDGHEVHVVLPCTGPLVQLLRDCGVQVHILPTLAIIDREQLGSFAGLFALPVRYVASTLSLIVLILRLNVDVVHTNTAVLPTPPLAARLTGRKSLWHIREFFFEFSSLWRVYQAYMWLLSSRIITISRAVEAQFSPLFRPKCTIIYDGLDEDASESNPQAVLALRASANYPKYLVGVVGRIKWVRKGQEVLVRAATLLRDRFPEVAYLVVGSVAPGNESHLQRLKELIHSNQLEDRFFFAGDVHDVRNVYSALDITCVPSIQPEPFGCVVMESMAIGTSVIGSRCGGISEQIIDGKTGFLVEPGNERELAEALARLLEDDSLRQMMGKAGQEHFRENFNMYHTYRQMLECFDGSIKQNASIANLP